MSGDEKLACQPDWADERKPRRDPAAAARTSGREIQKHPRGLDALGSIGESRPKRHARNKVASDIAGSPRLNLPRPADLPEKQTPG